jgi:hypothetical protein
MSVPIGGGTNKDALPQDVTSESVLLYLTRSINDVTLSVPAVIDQETVELSPGHGVVSGEMLCFVYGLRFSQFKVTNVATNTISLDMPLDYSYPVEAIVKRKDYRMEKDGSSTTLSYKITPLTGSAWDVYEIVLTAETSAEPGPTKFMGITALTKGIYLRIKDGMSKNFGNIKRDSDFKEYGISVEYDEKAPSGNYLVNVRLKFKEGLGTIPRIYCGDEITVCVRDNLSGGTILRMVCLVKGHVVVL